VKRSVVTIVIALVAALILPTTSSAAPKAGAKCPKKGKIQVYKSYEYTCVKKSGKLIWSKGKKISESTAANPENSPTPEPTPAASPIPSTNSGPAPLPTSTPSPTTTPRDWNSLRSTDMGYIHDYNSWCDIEKDLPISLKRIEDAYVQATRCSGIYRVAKYQLGDARPKSAYDNSYSVDTAQCQISEPADSRHLRGFMNLWEQGRRDYYLRNIVPGPKMKVQIIPIYASDTAQPLNTPADDYEPYLSFFEEWAKYSSDGETNIQIRIPNQYFKFSKKVSEYGLYHENNHDNPGHTRFVNDLVGEVDEKIDFTGANAVLVLVPPGTPLINFQQAAVKNFNTKEGRIESGSTMYPLTLNGLETTKYSSFLVPFWWIHEMYHTGFGFDDHYGDGQRNVSTEYGMGWWSLMTPWGGDLLAWEKWIAGFTTDSQVHCVKPNGSTVRWIAPSSVKTKEKKLIVIPISQTKGIMIESVRAAGLYYKIPKRSEGVLVYVADLEIKGHGYGLKLVLPENLNLVDNSFFLSDASLQSGDSVITNGYKITVVESGNFGDVVRIEKA